MESPRETFSACLRILVLLAALVELFTGLMLFDEVSAGGGPETLLVVVNARSPLSLRVANEYVNLRNIPREHVVWLDQVPSMETISIDVFREKIWAPIRDFIRLNHLDEEIDIIAYSADFPYAVNFSSDIKSWKLPKNKLRGSVASLTALTYFARSVESGDIRYLKKNHYFREFAKKMKKGGMALPLSLSKVRSKQIKQLRKEARAALKHGNYDLAVGKFQEVLNHYPGPRGWYDLARSKAAAGDKDSAMTSLSEAVDWGWTQSLMTAKDKYLSVLHGDERFHKLLERMASAYGPFELSHGFRNHYVWSNAGLRFWTSDDVLNQYYLSTMLAYTGLRGNSLPEILDYLDSAAASDGANPSGTVYLMENSNIRSETRQPLFPATIRELAKRGRNGEILSKGKNGQNGKIPVGRNDVIGAVVGSRSYQWGKGDSRLLPGAIAESLTSYGGDFNRSSQTKLSEFLRHGAAGSSGAVAEPYALQGKFPVPLIHVYYADGCSLAESFFQSILYPYQLVIVGDPLARPFAEHARVEFTAPSLLQPWSGVVSIESKVQPAFGKAIRKVELWVDGQYLSDAPIGESIIWDTGTVDDGYHDIRLVAVEDSLIETRSFKQVSAQVMNKGLAVQVNRVNQSVLQGDNILISGKAFGAERVELYQGTRLLDEAPSGQEEWQLKVPSTHLGTGPNSLFVRAVDEAGESIRSDPVKVFVPEPGRLKPGLEKQPSGEGLAASLTDHDGKMHYLTIRNLSGRLKEIEKQKIKVHQVNLRGFFRITEPGFYQIAVKTQGHVQFLVDNEVTLDANLSKEHGEAFIPLSLESGWHELRIDLVVSGKPWLKAVLSGAGSPVLLSGQNLAHHPTLLSE